jgi:hypothetical protein
VLVHHTSANPSNPNISVDTAITNASTYRAIDSTNPNHFISGTLGGQGVLEFAVVARTQGQTSSVSGQDFFAAMMAHFGVSNVRTIRAHWSAGIDLDTNIDQFNDATQRGLQDNDAAKETWTGQRARDYGLTNTRVIFKNPQGDHPGQYVEVTVEFTR